MNYYFYSLTDAIFDSENQHYWLGDTEKPWNNIFSGYVSNLLYLVWFKSQQEEAKRLCDAGILRRRMHA